MSAKQHTLIIADLNTTPHCTLLSRALHVQSGLGRSVVQCVRVVETKGGCNARLTAGLLVPIVAEMHNVAQGRHTIGEQVQVVDLTRGGTAWRRRRPQKEARRRTRKNISPP
jgi:hypothetical protein